MNYKRLFTAAVGFSLLFTVQAGSLAAQEVNKGEIPDAQLEETYKTLDWQVKIWDLPEAIEALKKDKNVIWVDTRPASFYDKGTVEGAVNLVYDKKGNAENTLNDESLAKAIQDAGMDKATAKVVFFCQGPKCHRSYNATYVAVSEWDYPADNIIWFRSGYPYLFKEVKENPKLKRKAKNYISAAGMKQL